MRVRAGSRRASKSRNVALGLVPRLGHRAGRRIPPSTSRQSGHRRATRYPDRGPECRADGNDLLPLHLGEGWGEGQGRLPSSVEIEKCSAGACPQPWSQGRPANPAIHVLVNPAIEGLPGTPIGDRNAGQAETIFSLSIWERAGVRVRAGSRRASKSRNVALGLVPRPWSQGRPANPAIHALVNPAIEGLPGTPIGDRNAGQAETIFSLSIWERAGVRVNQRPQFFASRI